MYTLQQVTIIISNQYELVSCALGHCCGGIKIKERCISQKETYTLKFLLFFSVQSLQAKQSEAVVYKDYGTMHDAAAHT